MITRDDILRRLDAIADPDGGSVRSRVRSLVVNEGRVGLALAGASTDRDRLELLRAEVEAAVGALEGVSAVLAAIVEDEANEGEPEPARLGARARRLAGRIVGGRGTAAPGVGQAAEGEPARNAHGASAEGASSEVVSALQSQPQRPKSSIPAGIKRIVAVGSGKGGVGKSTVAVNLAVAFAAMGQRVGLVDADIFGPSVPILLGAPDYRPGGGELQPLRAHGIAAMSIGFLVDPERAVVWRGPMVTGALMQLVRDTKWGALDVLFIDMPPGTGDIQLSLAQQLPLDGAVVVTTPQDLALADVRKAIQMFDTVKVPILGIVENMATFVCPCCGTATPIFGEGGGEREALSRGVEFLGRLPLSSAVRAASDAGAPPAGDPSSAAGAAYAAIASNLAGVLQRHLGRQFPAIVFEDA